MKLLYIASPYRAKEPWRVEVNIQAALTLAREVVKITDKWFPVVPQANTAHFDGMRSDQYFLDGTLEMLRKCDAVLMGPWWQDSDGCCAEYVEAERLGLPIFESLGEFRNHVQAQG